MGWQIARSPVPEVIAQERTNDLAAALEQFATIAEEMGKVFSSWFLVLGSSFTECSETFAVEIRVAHAPRVSVSAPPPERL